MPVELELVRMPHEASNLRQDSGLTSDRSVSCDNHAITRNIKSQLDDLTSNNLALVDADSWLDPVVSDRLPESRHLSDALRDLNNEADSRHAEQMDCMKSLVGSLSSIQSLLSSRSLARPQTPNRNGSFHSPKRSPARDDLETFHTKRPFAAESIEDSQEGGAKAYSCGAVLGIEELLTESGQCFFCELSNTSPHLGREQMQFLDAFSFGKHLVDEHQFGACSSQCYRDFSHFSQHLFEFHHVRSLTWSAVRRHERLRDMGGQEMFFVGEDILDQTEADLDPARGEIEPRPATASIIEAQLAQILSKAGVLDGEADSETHDPLTRKKRVASEGWRQGSDIALLNLGCQKLLSQGPSWDTALEALYQTTRLREEVMISGLDSELPFHRFNQNQQHMEGTRLHLYRNAYEGTYAENSGKSCVLLKLPKLASWYRELATACWYCTRAYKTGWVFQDSRAVQVHLKAFPHEMDDQAVSAFLTSKVQVLPRVLNVSYGGSSTLERIDRWMLHCFLESANWRVLFRLSNPLGPSVDSNMEDWEVAVLQHWCEDGNRRERHMTPASDSAPSKAGSFATRSKRSWPTHFGDQGTNSEVSQGPRKKARIGDDRSQ